MGNLYFYSICGIIWYIKGIKMKKFTKFLYKNYITKNSKILNIDPIDTDWYDYMISQGHNKFNLISLTVDKKIYELFKSKKYYCIYGNDLYDKIHHNFEDEEYDIIFMLKSIKDPVRYIDEIYWLLKDDKYFISVYDNIKYISFDKFRLNKKYKEYLIFKRYYE
jgi:hypothetical protein